MTREVEEEEPADEGDVEEARRSGGSPYGRGRR